MSYVDRRKNVSRSIRRSIAKRALRDEIYEEKRLHFELQEKTKGWWKPQTIGWVVVALIVEGASCAAPMGSLGHVVEEDISPMFPTKFGAYRWLVENVQDFDDVYHYTDSRI